MLDPVKQRILDRLFEANPHLTELDRLQSSELIEIFEALSAMTQKPTEGALHITENALALATEWFWLSSQVYLEELASNDPRGVTKTLYTMGLIIGTTYQEVRTDERVDEPEGG